MNHPTKAAKSAPRAAQPPESPCCVCGGPANMHICGACAAVARPTIPAVPETPTVANTVVCRKRPRHRFDVDGEPFPWFLHEDGPRFSLVGTGLHLVHVRLIPILIGGGREDRFTHDCRSAAPVIAGVAFPWHIDERGLVYRASRNEVPTVELSFYAEHVDTDGQIGIDLNTLDIRD